MNLLESFIICMLFSLSSPLFRIQLFLFLGMSWLSLRPALLSRRTKLSPRLLLQPILLPLHVAHLVVLFAVSKKVDPVLQRIMHLTLCPNQLHLLHLLHLGSGPLGVRLRVVQRQEHVLHASHVGRAILGKAPCDKGPGGIAACEVVVGASGAVDVAPEGDVEDGAVDGDVDGFGRVFAVVGGELLGGQVDGTLLSDG